MFNELDTDEFWKTRFAKTRQKDKSRKKSASIGSKNRPEEKTTGRLPGINFPEIDSEEE